MKITTEISAYDKKQERKVTVVDQTAASWNLDGPNPTAPLSVLMGNPNFTIMLDFEPPADENTEAPEPGEDEVPPVFHILEVTKDNVDILHVSGCDGKLEGCPVADDLINNQNRGKDLKIGEYTVEGTPGNLTYEKRKSS